MSSKTKRWLKVSSKTKRWLKAAGIRAIKTFAQTAAATIGVNATIGAVNWIAVGSAATVAAILSMLTSLAGLPEIKESEGENDG